MHLLVLCVAVNLSVPSCIWLALCKFDLLINVSWSGLWKEVLLYLLKIQGLEKASYKNICYSENLDKFLLWVKVYPFS